MMLTKNTDVAKGEANGSRVFAKRIKVKTGEKAFPVRLDCGTTVNALFASQVQAIYVEHENEDISPRRFDVSSETFNFTSKLQIGMDDQCLAMRGNQFPIISDTCTTGHKLQGCTVESALANDWFCGANWAYVVLSRVKTMAGLFFRTRLSTDLKKCAKPDAMKRMLQKFNEEIAVEAFTDEMHNDLTGVTHVQPNMPGLRDEESTAC